MHDYFLELPDEKKAELFHGLVSTVCDFLYREKYSFLHDLGMPDEEILARGYLTEEGMIAGGAKLAHLENSSMKLEDILQHDPSDDVFLVHAQGEKAVSLDALNVLTKNDQELFSDLMEAHVCESRAGELGTEIVIDGIEPERLEELSVTLDTCQRKPQKRYAQLLCFRMCRTGWLPRRRSPCGPLCALFRGQAASQPARERKRRVRANPGRGGERRFFPLLAANLPVRF